MYSVCEYIARFSKSQPQKTALIAQGKSYSYLEFYQWICGFSSYLKTQGFQSGEFVVCKASATLAYWVACLGTQLAGGIFVPVEKDCSIEKMQSIIQRLNGVFALISNSSDLQMQAEYRHAIDVKNVLSLAKKNDVDKEIIFPKYNDPACILFTTGTTGQAKGVIIPHKYLVESGLRTVNIPYSLNTVILIPVPMNHSFGMGRSIVTWVLGGTVVLLDGLTNLLDFYNALTIHKVNAMAIAPSGLNYLLALMGDEWVEYNDQFVFMEIGGEKMPYVLQEMLIKLLPSVRLYIGYASTETGMVCSYEFSKYGATNNKIGVPIAQTEVFMTDEEGNKITATAENPGFISITSDSMMKGYWRDEQATNGIKKGNTIVMSDYGYVDKEGFVCLLGRAGDVIISGGQKINPTEVEDCALKSGMIEDCVCFGEKDDMFGNRVCLLVVIKAGLEYDENAIKGHLTENLEYFKVPKIINHTDKIQRNKNGKIDRKYYRK